MDNKEKLALKRTEWAILKATRMYCEKIIEEKETSKDLSRDFNILRYCATSLEAIHRTIEGAEPLPTKVLEKTIDEDARQEMESDSALLLLVAEQAIRSLNGKGYSEVQTALDVLGRLTRAVAQSYNDFLSGGTGLAEIMEKPLL